MSAKISVIIPVYKTARTLDRCVKSVVSQEGAELEIILVDDGSPDDSPAMCDTWGKADSRVTVVHKANGGLSEARNSGLERATGERLMFVDSDDFLAPGTLRSLADTLEEHPEYDILEFPVYRMYGLPRQSVLAFGKRAYTSAHDYWIGCRAYTHSYAWNKVYHRRLFNDVRFPAGRLFEDVYTLPLLLRQAKVVATTDQGMYFYTYNEGGITATADGKAWRMLLEAHIRLLGKFKFSSAEEQNYYMHILDIQIYENELTGDTPLLPTTRISIRHVDRRFRIKAFLLRILGVKMLCRANRIFRSAVRRKV